MLMIATVHYSSDKTINLDKGNETGMIICFIALVALTFKELIK